MPNPRAVRQLKHLFEILLGNLKRLSRDVGNVLSDQLAWINAGLLDLLQQKAAEWLHPGSEECAVEGNINALERDCGKASLELDRLRFGFSLLGASANDLHELSLDLFE